MTGAPIETHTHSLMFVTLACQPLHPARCPDYLISSHQQASSYLMLRGYVISFILCQYRVSQYIWDPCVCS